MGNPGLQSPKEVGLWVGSDGQPCFSESWVPVSLGGSRCEYFASMNGPVLSRPQTR